ncbi:tetratricopeptide repeat protein 25 [Folsomia candida]|uniref:Outer dynein arm-docking complex subunit 4 n=1 Tax=Folsomia candida TaxID=158441 RepID=A0A226EPZ8_FOLCA|nr:tetratricopeptide repeat protein 25 [Folsomia candida]OXA59227.1 Tetratricopeptide repeat protein 25 [Folsomia candida]
MAKQELKYSECPIPKSTFTTFMDEGGMHYRAGHFRKALFCFDRALELQSTSKAALVWRSQCHLKLGDAQAALKDAQASFESDDTYIQGLYQYAEALFNLGQFEQAAISYHRGFRARRDKEEFRVGINKCQEAIRRAIGERQATQIEDLEVILPQIDEINNTEKGNAGHCCVLDRASEIELRKKGIKKNVTSKARARWVDREVLGVLQQDKDYLTKFLKRPDIEGNHQSGSDSLRTSAKEALKYLEIREQFWRMQNPMYSRKVGLNFNNDMVIQYEKQELERMEACRKIKMDAAQGAVLKNLTQIEHALQIGRAQDCQLECERALRQIKEISLRLLPRKPEFTTQILHFKGLALLKLKNFDAAVATFQEEFNVAVQHKMPEIKSRALDFLGRSFALKGSYAEAAEVWDSRLAIAKTPVERAYLYHEIGRCYYETNKLDLAKIYAHQSLEEAVKINDDIWAMNACILLGQCDTKTRSFEKALDHFEKAEDYALKCGNKGNVTLLREGQQCIKVYLDKQNPDSAAPNKRSSSHDSADLDHQESEDSFHET